MLRSRSARRARGACGVDNRGKSNEPCVTNAESARSRHVLPIAGQYSGEKRGRTRALTTPAGGQGQPG